MILAMRTRVASLQQLLRVEGVSGSRRPHSSLPEHATAAQMTTSGQTVVSWTPMTTYLPKYEVWQKSNATGNAVHKPTMLLPPPSHGS